MRHSLAALTFAVLFLEACASAPPRMAAPPARPPLVVVLVVDQMRTSYLENWGGQFTGGLERLLTEGAWFRRASFPYLNTVTCAGHSTIGTGALPYTHGMVLNAWWDRQAAQLRPCTIDPAVKNIALGATTTRTGGDSAGALRVKPFAQQLVENTGGRSVALSLKPRSAIPMVGANPSAVLWFDDTAGWTTSTAFGRQPPAWLQEYLTAHPFNADQGKTWERMLPEAAYSGADAGEGERAPSGWTTSFPHTIGEPATQLNAQWLRSPYADEYLGRLAAHAIDTLDLGRGAGTDFLSVSFSTLDFVGHLYGPDSHEVQDLLFRLDRTIGTFLQHLDARLGRDGYVLALTSDHGVARLPEQSGGGRQGSADVVAAVNKALEPFFGPGTYVVQTVYTDVYLAPGIAERLNATPAAARAVLDALRALPGVAHAFSADEIADPAVRSGADPIKRAAAFSYFKERSGDIIIVPREHWLLSSAATTHGTLYPYDQQVPVVFFGRGVKAGLQDAAATPADVAPTLAKLAGVSFKAPDGVALISR